MTIETMANQVTSPEDWETLDNLTDTLNDTIFEDFSDGLYIGMMSGTSLDGMDAVLCRFLSEDVHTASNGTNAIKDESSKKVQVLATHHVDFSDELKSALLALCQPNGIQTWLKNKDDSWVKTLTNSTSSSISELDVFGWVSVQYAEFASQVVEQLLTNSQYTADDVLAIGCHGQTVRHRPEWSFTLQLLDPNILAERTGISVVSDFRRRDMAVGGQGAPLVPAFHQALLSDDLLNCQFKVILNLGGIANITILPNQQSEKRQVLGFDTGVANLLLDAWCLRHTGQSFDKDGDWARSGEVVEPLLQRLLAHEFFAKPAPKSTGREDFNLPWLDNVLTQLDTDYPNLRYSSADVQATLTELTAVSVVNGIAQGLFKLGYIQQNLAELETDNLSLLVCGGGAYNQYLLERLQFHLQGWCVQSTDCVGLAPSWVESVAFAWLARQTMMSQPSNLPEVTGANKAVVLGVLCL